MTRASSTPYGGWSCAECGGEGQLVYRGQGLVITTPCDCRALSKALDALAGDPKDWERNNQKWKDSGL